MTLRVGPYLYRVRYVEGYIEHEGHACLGLCDNEAHVIHISNQMTEAEQIQTLCHEYMEAWIHHFGQGLRPSEADHADAASGDLAADERKEAWCDLFGLAMTQFLVDWMHQVRRFADQAEQSGTARPGSRAAGRDPLHERSASAPRRRTTALSPVRMRQSVGAASDQRGLWRIRIFERV